MGDACDPYDAGAVRAAMGPSPGRRYVRVSRAEPAPWNREHRATFVGTSPCGTAARCQFAYHAPKVVLVGWERTGLSRGMLRLNDALVRVPLAGRVDSLNVAAATAAVP